MILTHKRKLRLDSREDQHILDVVQGDSGRAIEFALQDGSGAWNVPEGTTAMIRYRRMPGNAGGLYDTLSDGTAAYAVNGNKLTVYLAPQVLAVAGMTELQVTLMCHAVEVTCFSVLLRIQGNVGEGITKEEGYVNLTSHIRQEVHEAMANMDQIVVGDNTADYYETLADALLDVNAGTADRATKVEERAKVKVFTAASGRLTVMLLADLMETQPMTLEKSADLVLAGHILQLTGGARIDLAADIDAGVYGGTNPVTGHRGAIAKTDLTNANMVIIQCSARSLVCKSVDMSAVGTTTGALYGIYARKGNGRLDLEDCTVVLENSAATSAIACAVRSMDPASKIRVNGCAIKVSAENETTFGVHYYGTMELVDSFVDVTGQTGENIIGLNDASGNKTCITGGVLHVTAGAGIGYGIWSPMGGNCEIHGSEVTVTTVDKDAYAVYSPAGGSFLISGSRLSSRSASVGDAETMWCGTATVCIEDSTIRAVVEGNASCQKAVAMYNGGVLRAKNTTFYADAQGGSVTVDHSIGVENMGEAHLEECTATGTHSGCNNQGKLYVSGGIYTGTTHGGFYFAHGEAGCAWVCDAHTRDGHYDGEFPEYWDNQPWVYWGAFYIGGGTDSRFSNLEAYLDGCTMEGVKHVFTMRGSSGETNNTVYLSNCTLVDGEKKPINFHNTTHRVVVGKGCNATRDMIFLTGNGQINPEMMIFTDGLYRNVSGDKVLNGRDYQVLARNASAATVVEDPVPDYVRTEAERLAALVQSRQNADTVTMLLGADIHARLGLTSGSYLTEQMLASTRHAAQAMKIIRDRVHIDLAGLLGDYIWDNGETPEQAMELYRMVAEFFAPAFDGLPQFWCKGNHDMLGNNASGVELTDAQVFSAVGIRNTGAVFHPEDRLQGYCYRDLEDFKLRVICMNTCQTRGSYAVSDVQNAWLAQALSLTGKSGWKSVILCHVPLDSWGADSTVLKNVANYADSILCVIHGHLHNYLIGTLTGTSIPRICIPNMDFYRTNEYGKNSTGEGKDGYIEYGQDVSYEKITGTAMDTAFCVVTMDLKNGKLYADHYGAGYDRVVDLNVATGDDDQTSGETGAFTNRIPLSTAAIGGMEVYNGVGYRAGVRLNSSFTEVAAAGMCCTGYIPVNVGDVIRIKNVTIYGANDPYCCVYTAAGAGSLSFNGSQMSEATVNGITTLVVTGDTSDQLYCRLSAGVIDGKSILTVNEEIV